MSTPDRPEGRSRLRAFLDRHAPPTPCLVIDLQTVRERYLQLSAALPGARLYYAVKANPEPDVLRLLVALGACFDVASVPEIRLCLAAGADPAQLSYGNTIKKRADIAEAYASGVRLFTSDSIADIEHLAAHAPGSAVFCRVLLTGTRSLTPFGSKFGCSPELAADLLTRAAERGLRPAGASFHVGSQQLDPDAWDPGVSMAAAVAAKLAANGVTLPMINVGGGLPGRYTQPMPPPAAFTTAITESVDRHFAAAGLPAPQLVLEPGRFLVADAGVLRSEVVLVSRRGTGDDRRWVYLDVGRYNGLAETENEYITYRLSTPDRDGPVAPVVLAGPTCDGDDVLYQHTAYELPTALQPGDHVDLLSAGAYTASYSAVGFNGFAPLATHCIPLPEPAGVGSFAGRHVLAEMDGIDATLLDDEPVLRDILATALDRAGATVLEVSSRRFDPQGITVLALLSESHASLHTYPEIGSVFIDVFTCGHRADPELAVRLIAAALHPVDVQSTTIRRGKEPR